jgi:type IV secretory pathway TrbD component
MAESQKPEGETKPPKRPRAPSNEESDSVPVTVARRAVAEVLLGAGNRVMTLVAVGLLAFASIFLIVAWQFGPLVWLEAQQYKKLTGHVDGRIVESWIALEFDAKDVRNPEFWRASTNAASCEVVEYSGDWGAPLRRAFCGTRVPFHDSYPVAKLIPVTEGVPFAWMRDKRGFVVPKIRVDPATVQWLKAHAPNKFMHQRWPANTALDWLRLELDLPVDAAIAGWTAPPPILPLSFDPTRPAEALPTGIVQKRLDQGTSWPAMLVGFGIGLYVWFKGMALMPLLSGMTPMGRWILSALPLLTLPWWMDGLPNALAYFSNDTAYLVREVFADIVRTDRLVAAEPEQATLANGERLVWNFDDSVYADTIGRFKFVQPNPPLASDKAAVAALTETVTIQARAFDDAVRAELFANLIRNRHTGLKEGEYVYLPAAKEAAADPAASAATRRSAKRFVDEWGLAVD